MAEEIKKETETSMEKVLARLEAIQHIQMWGIGIFTVVVAILSIVIIMKS